MSVETSAQPTSPAAIKWTNRSVLKLVRDGDPVATIQRLARDKVLQAIDAGWAGPPFNPIRLADLLKIRVEPKASVPDARTVPYEGGIKIEFNPLQARERLRFSIAHEVAHSLFPDVSDSVRHRGGQVSGDDWQLEMLCNIAAAEFIMPVGSLPPMQAMPPMEKLLEERQRFDVSTEAFLIRATRVTSEPTLMFCASVIESGDEAVRYRTDYVVQSRTWPNGRPTEVAPPVSTVLRDCTAIGYSSRAEEVWAGVGHVAVECVGIPPYPTSRYPRVAGLLRGVEGRSATVPTFQYVHGNVLDPHGKGPRIVCQLVNDAARRWGGGVALQAARLFPNAQKSYSLWFSSLPQGQRLGHVHFADASEGITIASLVAQRGYGLSDSPRIRYSALERCLSSVADEAESKKASVHLPRIGMGEAGGIWALTEDLLFDELVARGLSVSVYDLPPRREPGNQSLFDSPTD